MNIVYSSRRISRKLTPRKYIRDECDKIGVIIKKKQNAQLTRLHRTPSPSYVGPLASERLENGKLESLRIK